MDLTVISTFRCNSRCQMCYIWKNPTDPREEVSLETLSKLPVGFDNLNVSGGEPTLRTDLPELVDLLYPKCRIMEISSRLIVNQAALKLKGAAIQPLIDAFAGAVQGEEAHAAD